MDKAYINGNHYKIGFRGKVYVLRNGGEWCLCLDMDKDLVEDAIRKQKKDKRKNG